MRAPAEAERDVVGGLVRDRERGFADLVTAEQDALFAFLLGMTGDRGRAEDLTQESFWKAYRALARYPDEQVRSLRVRPWLRRIGLNTLRNSVRRRRVGETLAETPPDTEDPAEGPETATLRAEARARLLRALATVPASARAAILLRHVEDLSVDEVGEALGLPGGTVKSHVHRGLRRLRRALQEQDEEERGR